MTVDEQHPGQQLPYLLMGAFRRVIDELHRELAEVGHPEIRPVHAVAMQSIAPARGRLNEMAAVVGVSKQAMAKTIDRLEQLGYVTRSLDEQDRRARVVALTDRGIDALRQSGIILDRIYADLAEEIGPRRLTTTTKVLGQIRSDSAAFEQLLRWYGNG